MKPVLPLTSVRRGFPPLALGLMMVLGWTGTSFASNPEDEDHDTSPYHVALLDYKSGHAKSALEAINKAEKARPNDPATEILKARILTDLGQYDEGAALLEGLGDKVELNAAYDEARILALGDLRLRQRHFDDAAKSYEKLLAIHHDDPDLMLKLIYTRVSVSDFVDAGKLASQLKPLDADHPSYYFAKAALAQSAGKTGEAEEDIQTARTIYGITTANRYLKTYLEVFALPDNTPAARAEPPATNTPAAHP